MTVRRTLVRRVPARCRRADRFMTRYVFGYEETLTSHLTALARRFGESPRFVDATAPVP